MKPFCLALLSFLATAIPASAEDAMRVGGYFCDTREDQIAFLTRRAAGDNEIMAANAVNKAVGKATCADYVSVEVVPAGEKVVVSDGLVFKMHRVIFLPENVERWIGSVTDSLSVQVAERQDI